MRPLATSPSINSSRGVQITCCLCVPWLLAVAVLCRCGRRVAASRGDIRDAMSDGRRRCAAAARRHRLPALIPRARVDLVPFSPLLVGNTATLRDTEEICPHKRMRLKVFRPPSTSLCQRLPSLPSPPGTPSTSSPDCPLNCNSADSPRVEQLLLIVSIFIYLILCRRILIR